MGDPDAAGSADAGPSGNGLSLAFSTTPAVPGPLLLGATLDSVDFYVKDLRITGDAAPGDDRTHAAMVALSWGQELAPPPASFPTAPPGHYSKIAFKLENDTGPAFKIRGTAYFNGTPHPYLIQDENSVSVSVPMNVTLDVGGSASDTLRVNLYGVLVLVDWTQAELDSNGNITLDDNQLHAFHDALGLAFRAASTEH
jgi:hypothetical protein